MPCKNSVDTNAPSVRTGVVIVPSVHLALGTLNGKLYHHGDDCIAIIVRAKCPDFFVVQVYMLSGVGIVGNAVRIRNLAEFIISIGLLCNLFGGWNMTPSELGECTFYELIRAQPLVRKESEATCFLGRCLDFFVCSTPLLPALSPLRAIVGPWKRTEFLSSTPQ